MLKAVMCLNLSSACFLKFVSRKHYCVIIIPVMFFIYYGINISDMLRNVYQRDDSKGQKIVANTRNAYKMENTSRSSQIQHKRVHHILLWGDNSKPPFSQFKEGHTVFQENNCAWTNCHVTSDRNYLSDYTQFDVIVFNAVEISELRSTGNLPRRRLPHQRYVFMSTEAASNYPICTDHWNSYFNWTWTYRLDSDVIWRYYIIKNNSDYEVGPSPNITWQIYQNASELDEVQKLFFKTKSKSAAWYVSNCNTMSLREDMAKEIQKYMNIFQLQLDTFGECGKLHCPKTLMMECLNKLEEQYFFYFAFENALCEDYVTEKVLHALQHNTVPVVYGGANYSRFLPPGSYLDVGILGPRKLAENIYKLMKQPENYLTFFKWQKYYHMEYDEDFFCRVCAQINKHSPPSTYHHFRGWWMPLNSCADTIVAKIH